jgi:amidase
MSKINMDSILVEHLCLGRNGPTVAVKDTIDIAGYATRAGSRALENVSPALRHSDVVQALIDGGCRIIGKANLHELAFGVTGINHWTGTPINPRFPDRVPGGSSSGSAAAVASGVADIGLGTDTGGSIRVPAACCGIIGFKPTFGRVSRVGVHPTHTSLDCVGPLAREMAQIERAMKFIDPTFRPEQASARPILGWVKTNAAASINAAMETALLGLQVDLRPVELRHLEHAFRAGLVIIAAETHDAFGHLTNSGLLGGDVHARLLAAREVSAAEIDAAEHVRRDFTAEVDAALADINALVLPTMPCPPPLLSETDSQVIMQMTALVRPFNLSGHPAISLPLVGSELPIGLQIIGHRGGDAALCALARKIECAQRSTGEYTFRS